MRLRLSDPEFADNLRDFLERRECAVVEIDAEHLRSGSRTNSIRNEIFTCASGSRSTNGHGGVRREA